MLDPLPDDESKALMQLNDGSAGGRNAVVAIDTATGRRQVLAKAPRDDCEMVLDAIARSRGMPTASRPRMPKLGYDEHTELYRLGDGDSWSRDRPRQRTTPRACSVVGTAADGRIYALASDGGAPPAFGILDPTTDTFQSLYQDPVAGIHDFLYAADGKTVVGVVTMAGAPHVELVDRQHPDAKVYAALSKAFPGELVDVTSATRDGKKIVVTVYSDIDPGQLYLYDRDSGNVRFLMKNRPALDPAKMAHVQPFSFKARDGKTLYGYMTVPRGDRSDCRRSSIRMAAPSASATTGDSTGKARCSPAAAISSSRSTSAVPAATARRSRMPDMANGAGRCRTTSPTPPIGSSSRDTRIRKRMCIYGASYGGYASLMGAAREPTLYQCAVGYVGVYDLNMMFHEGDISERDSGQRYLKRTLGADAPELRQRSPAYLADQIQVPVFLAAGLKDVRAPYQHTEAMRDALKAAGHPADVVILQPNEMHGFYDEDANLNLYTKMLAFFDKYIGDGARPAAGFRHH